MRKLLQTVVYCFCAMMMVAALIFVALLDQIIPLLESLV